MVVNYSDASLEELLGLLKRFMKIKAEYGQEKRPEIEHRITQLTQLIEEKERK